MKYQFIKSAAEINQSPPPNLPEVAIMGRSNAGKSSFINALVGGVAAKVSSTPGKTRLLNFFQVGDHYRYVDMPGYGFAAVGAAEQRKWQKLIEDFLKDRPCLVGGILVMDCRRKWTQDEQDLMNFFYALQIPLAVLLNKTDKLNNSEKSKKKKEIKAALKHDMVFMVSALKKRGIKEAEKEIFEHWIRPNMDCPWLAIEEKTDQEADIDSAEESQYQDFEYNDEK